MPDISMCQAICSASKTCRRHTDSGTIPHPQRQSWADFRPDSSGRCPSYMHTDTPKEKK